MPVEIFRPVAGYEGLYKVSNLGRVRSLGRFDTKGRRVKGRFIGFPNKDGRHVVKLCKDGQRETCVAVLVAEAFLGPANGRWVLHWDDDCSNDRLENLRYGTPQDNSDDRARNGRIARGEKHGQSKLTTEQARQIKQLLAQGMTQKRISGLFEVSVSAVHEIKHGRNWRWV